MPSIASQLETLAGIKSDIKAAIIDKGQTVGDDFSTYATAIGNIEGGGGGGTVIKQGAVSAGAVSEYWNPGNYESDLETQTLIDSLFSKIDISDLHTDFNANLSSVSQAVATAIGFSYNSTNNIIYYDFENTNDNKNGFKFVEDNGTISLYIFIDNVATSSSITFEDSYKYLVYNTDSNGSVCLLFGDKDGIPQFGSMPYFLYASPCSYMYNYSHEASHEEGFVYPYESIGYIPYMSFSPLNYNIWSSGGYPGYPDHGFEDYGIYLIPYGWSNIDTNPIHCYFNNIYLISKFGYMSGNNYIINIEGTYYLIFSADEGNGGGVAFRLAKSESSLIGRVATGTFTTGSVAQQRVEINCGFQPDIVIVDLLFSNQHTTCMCYAPHSSSVWDVRPAESVVHPVPMNTNGETGISEITSTGFNFRVNGNNTFNLPCEYTAIKL